MHAARGGHAAIRLAKPHHTTITSPAKKEEVRPIGSSIVSGLDPFVHHLFWGAFQTFPPLGVPTFDLFGVALQRLPYFDQRREGVRSNGGLWGQRPQDRAAA